MPALLFGIGVFALFAGLAMVGFGVPINEFSFGNTLISAGTTAAVGGLIIIGLSVVVGQLRRVAEALAVQPSARLGQPTEAFESAAAVRSIPAQGHIPFPPRPRSEAHTGDPGPISPARAGAPMEDKSAESFAPALRNPDLSPPTDEDDISLSPHQPLTPVAQPGASRESPAGWRSPPPPGPSAATPQTPHSANFDAMWPAEAKFPKEPADGEPLPEPRSGFPSRDGLAASPKPEAQKPRAAAILKSGVVDGMGYTLYVDGSIEAELPQGTLRFASINELRNHLAKNS